MRKVFEELFNIMKQNAKLIFVVGKYHEWKFSKEETWLVDGARILIDLARSVGFFLEKEILHDLSKIDMGKIRRESLIILRKNEKKKKKVIENVMSEKFPSDSYLIKSKRKKIYKRNLLKAIYLIP